LPATCATSSKVLVDGSVEKHLCYVKTTLTAYFAKLHCQRNKMRLYEPNSSTQALKTLIAFAKKTLKGKNVFVHGRSGKICQAMQGNGKLKYVSCKLAYSFVCEFMETTTTVKTNTTVNTITTESCLVHNQNIDTPGIITPMTCFYFDEISSDNTVIMVNRTFAKEDVVQIMGSLVTATKFLPVDLVSTFPNLQGIGFSACSISEISYRSFKGLSKLKDLWLSYNRISKLDGKVFKDLVNLKVLAMGEFYLHDF
jgi:hypothetical protein